MSIEEAGPEKHPFQDERDAIARRRETDSLADGDKIYGLALSGGGIRSATFCLGLVRALAKNGKFRRYDYLSTVSGGGYLGGMLGRLYNPENNATAVEEGLARDESILLSWLRKNGRYLTPAGTRDLLLAFTQILRSFFAALALVTFSCLVVTSLAYYLNSDYLCVPYCGPRAFHWVVLFPLLFAALIAAGYWIFTRKRQLMVYLTVGSLCIIVLYALLTVVSPLLLIVLTALILYSAGRCFKGKKATLSQLRLQMTQATCTCLLIAAGMFLMWALFQAGYALYFWYSGQGEGALRYFLPPSLLALLRGIWEIKPLKQWLSQLAAKKKMYSLSLMHAGNLLGFVLMVFALVSVFAAMLSLSDELPNDLSSWLPAMLGASSLILLVLLCKTRVIVPFLNLSSLHNLYRARLERAWISVGNYLRPGKSAQSVRFQDNPLSARVTGSMDHGQIKAVTIPLRGDDISMSVYHPQQYGGPIHLITCCINQTVDDRSGNYNADRKGINLTVSSFGGESGLREPSQGALPKKLWLSGWLAISGAAAATGMGSQTAPGLAFLLFLLGGRLGYWQPRMGRHASKAPGEKKPSRLCYLFAEMFARFPGFTDDFWYLSDGGHFENTAVYPLLKRRVDNIVVADCGADPSFIFKDLENLVRKAKIDMAIDITFPDVVDPRFTSVEALKTSKTGAPLILATIHYPAMGDLPAKTGDLIIVKPHRLEGMSLATSGYASRNADFPQQTTGDQFFDEEQWEAYHQLGLEAGKMIP